MKKLITDSEISRLTIEDTHIPDIFVLKYSFELSYNALLLYLWIKTFSFPDGFTAESAKKLRIISSKDVDEALSDLVSHNILLQKGDQYSFVDLKEQEVSEYVEAVKAKSFTEGSLDCLTVDEKERQVLCDSINSTFFQGLMPYYFYRLIDKCLYEYKFASQVVYKLFEEGSEKGLHRSCFYMDEVATTWHHKGFNDIEKLDKQLNIEKRVNELVPICGEMLRIRLNGMQIRRITHWVEDFDVSVELVTYAIQRNSFRNTVTFKHIEDTLTKWFDHGIKTVEEASKFDEVEHKENKRKATRRNARSKSGSAWMTGEEAGIVAKEPDDILDMFDEKPQSDTTTATEEEDPEIDALMKSLGEANEDD